MEENENSREDRLTEEEEEENNGQEREHTSPEPKKRKRRIKRRCYAEQPEGHNVSAYMRYFVNLYQINQQPTRQKLYAQSKLSKPSP